MEPDVIGWRSRSSTRLPATQRPQSLPHPRRGGPTSRTTNTAGLPMQTCNARLNCRAGNFLKRRAPIKPIMPDLPPAVGLMRLCTETPDTRHEADHHLDGGQFPHKSYDASGRRVRTVSAYLFVGLFSASLAAAGHRPGDISNEPGLTQSSQPNPSRNPHRQQLPPENL